MEEEYNVQRLDYNQPFTMNEPLLKEFTNHSTYYVLYPTSLLPFAQNWLKTWLEWADGYVPEVHAGTNGIVSTRLAETIINRVTDQIFGGGLLFARKYDNEQSNKALDFISNEIERKTDLSNNVLKAIKLASAGGTSYFKINISRNGELWFESYRADECYADFDLKRKVKRVKFLIKKFAHTVRDKNEQEENYYIIEERFYATEKDNKRYQKKFAKEIQALKKAPSLEIGKPYVEYHVQRMSGMVNQDITPSNVSRALNWEELPDDFKKDFKENFGETQLNVPKRIPLADIGVVAFKWTNFISNLTQLPYGESIIEPIRAYLYFYDVCYSCMNTDLYLGRGRVMIPKSLQSPNVDNNQQYNQGLDNFLYTKIEYSSTDDKKPEPIQFDIRSNDWLQTRNNLLESMATMIGISPSTLASYLQDSSARTAREISSEESATALFVENKRKLFLDPINQIIDTILTYNGYTPSITARFSKSGQTNTTLLIENAIKLINARLISTENAVKMINPDMTEDEIQAELEKIAEDNERQMAMFNPTQGEFN